MITKSSNIRVYVIDDDEGILDAIQSMLEYEGFQVKTYDRDLDIIKQLADESPDIILMDLLLSGADGKVITQQLKKMPALKKIPVIMLSAHPEAGEKAKSSGANDFLPKPFDMDELIAKIYHHTASN